jgi:Domain of unknown function (DUF4190)
MEAEIPPVVPSPLPADAPKNNKMALTSLITGIAGLVLLCLTLLFSVIPFVNFVCGCPAILLAIAALVTGLMARNQIKTSGEGGNGMALAGIIMGGVQIVLLVCSVLVILIMVILGPAIGNVFSTINASLK